MCLYASKTRKELNKALVVQNAKKKAKWNPVVTFALWSILSYPGGVYLDEKCLADEW